MRPHREKTRRHRPFCMPAAFAYRVKGVCGSLRKSLDAPTRRFIAISRHATCVPCYVISVCGACAIDKSACRVHAMHVAYDAALACHVRQCPRTSHRSTFMPVAGMLHARCRPVVFCGCAHLRTNPTLIVVGGRPVVQAEPIRAPWCAAKGDGFGGPPECVGNGRFDTKLYLFDW